MHRDNHPPTAITDHPSLAIYGLEGGPRPRTLSEIARTTMALFPAAVAVDWAGTQLSYGELATTVNEQVKHLHQAGIGRGDRVGIHVPPGTLQPYVAVLATLFAGAAYVPVDWEGPEGRAEAIWKKAEVDAVYGPDLDLRVLRERSGQPDTSAPRPEDDAYILFSGPEDQLEGNAATHRSAAAIADSQTMTFLTDAPLRPGDRVMTRHSMTSLPSMKEMWLAWRQGAALVPTPCSVLESADDMGTWIRDRGITAVATKPSLAAAWSKDMLAHVRLLILGGETLPRELVSRLHSPGREIWNGFRETWTSGRVSDWATGAMSPECVGRPIPGTRLCVVDPEGNPVQWGEVGEAVITGALLDRVLDPVKDAEKYPPLPSLGWDRAYRTGTLVRAERGGLVPVSRVETPVQPDRPRQRKRRWLFWK